MKRLINRIRGRQSADTMHHITDNPLTIHKTYYKKVKNGNHRYYIWVMMTNEGLVHVKMHGKFKPGNGMVVLGKYPKGHKPKHHKPKA